MLYLMLLDFLLSFPGSIHFICSSFLGFLSYLNAIGTDPCAPPVRQSPVRYGGKTTEGKILDRLDDRIQSSEGTDTFYR